MAYEVRQCRFRGNDARKIEHEHWIATEWNETNFYMFWLIKTDPNVNNFVTVPSAVNLFEAAVC